MRAVLWTAGLLAVMGLVTGCSSKCEAVCGEANACSVDQRAVDVDCPEYCAAVDELHARASKAGQESCDKLFQDHLSCWEKNSAKICDKAFEGCKEAAEAWTACMTPYCAAIKAEGGTDPSCDDGDPTLLPF